MSYRSQLKKLTGSAILIALGLVLPLCFHAIPNGGSIFSPIHIPVLVGGFLFGPAYGTAIGILAPLLNSLATGMPPLYPVLPGMMVECAVYGLASGLFFRLIKTRKFGLDLYLSLIVAMVLGRFAGAFVNYLVYMGTENPYGWQSFVNAYLLVGWPAIIIQLALIPPLVYALFRTRLFTEADRVLFPSLERKKTVAKETAHFSSLAADWAKKGPVDIEKGRQILAPLGDIASHKVLDVGCGTGVLIPSFLSLGAIPTGLDAAKKMLEEARKAYPRVEFVEADFYASHLEAGAYDELVVYDAYPHFLDVDSFAQEARRLLKKGGRGFSSPSIIPSKA